MVTQNWYSVIGGLLCVHVLCEIKQRMCFFSLSSGFTPHSVTSIVSCVWYRMRLPAKLRTSLVMIHWWILMMPWLTCGLPCVCVPPSEAAIWTTRRRPVLWWTSIMSWSNSKGSNIKSHRSIPGTLRTHFTLIYAGIIFMLCVQTAHNWNTS